MTKRKLRWTLIETPVDQQFGGVELLPGVSVMPRDLPLLVRIAGEVLRRRGVSVSTPGLRAELPPPLSGWPFPPRAPWRPDDGARHEEVHPPKE